MYRIGFIIYTSCELVYLLKARIKPFLGLSPT
jgi:hypothetical protein